MSLAVLDPLQGQNERYLPQYAFLTSLNQIK